MSKEESPHNFAENKKPAKNIIGSDLVSCCFDPLTGFFRDGYCNTNAHDRGAHVVCAMMTNEFLKFTRGMGNDLNTPRPEFNFPGLKEGDFWCVCALRWEEARKAGVAPPIKPEATHERALELLAADALVPYFLH